MSIIGFLVALIVIGVLLWAVRTLSAALGIPPPIVTVIYVVMVVLTLLWILQALGLWAGGPVLRVN